ncbi:unnamed protein product [Pleuronectes platessa]|uniref:Uncharacterized protein n=1 Tax=Pleuronectes platessa TaxID=8262 RepID=A0A9N7U2Z3_PLEPL|nr:unnamed protein product [Pleuronectes platessa]
MLLSSTAEMDGTKKKRRTLGKAVIDPACGTPQRFFGGEVLFRGASRRQWYGGFLSLGPRGGVLRRCRRRAVGRDRVRRSAAATLDACRDLSRITSATAPARGTLRSRGGPPWRCASAGA